MNQSDDKLLDVLIVGAGPAGLMMACQLALHKITFRIIDLKTTPPVYSGALIIHARTLEIFQQMGIAENVLEMGITADYINMQFNNRKSYLLNLANFGERLSPFPYMVMIEQWKTETLLQKFLSDFGICLENATSLKSFSQDDNMVISAISKADNSTEIIRSKFLIGADGKDSFVRNHLQIPFPGRSQNSRLFITDCEANIPYSDREIFFSFTNEVTSGFFPLKGERRRVDGLIPSIQHNDVSFNDIAHFYNNQVQGGIKLTHSTWFSVFRSHSKCADQFRLKRCFLIGDAAHIHSPVGAQGMNTGIQDAYNLAWKLSYFIQGKAFENLLTTYQMERKPVALKTIHYTDMAYSFMTNNNLLAKFSRLHLLPLVMPKLIGWLKNNQKMRTRIFSAISGIGIKYNNNILSASLNNDDFNQQAPKPGERLPYTTYDTKIGKLSLHKDIIPTHFCLFIFGRNIPSNTFQVVLDKYKNIINVKYLNLDGSTQKVYDKLGIKEEGFYLIRPDLYIACRSHKLNADALNNYLQKFLL